MNEQSMRQAYDRLVRRRTREDSAALVPLEVVRELAETPSIADGRIATLDQILAHPVTRAEFYVLREIARRKPLAHSWGMRGWTALAALFIVGLGLAVVMRESAIRGPEPLRGPNELALVAPAASTSLDQGTRFIWRSLPDVASYTIELIDADGSSIWRQATPDTLVTLPASVPLRDGARYTWLVRASLLDGTTVRSAPRSISARP